MALLSRNIKTKPHRIIHSLSQRLSRGIKVIHFVLILATFGLTACNGNIHLVRAPNPLEAPAEINPPLTRITIVSMGDSYSSGEGAPDDEAVGCIPDHQCISAAKWNANDQWNGAHPSLPVPSDDDTCDRSIKAGPRQAVDAFRDIAGVPVDFVSVACSGAQVADLISAEWARGNARDHIPLQIDQVAQLFPNRQRIDVLIIGIGGNDVGFGPKVEQCMAPPLNPLAKPPFGGCYQLPSVGTGDNDPIKLARDLSARYDRLAAVIQDRLNVGVVLITEYPNPMFNDDGQVCHDQPPGDPLMGIQQDEAEWAANTVIPMLNGTIQAAVRRNADKGWQYVGNVASGFMGHGYCASDPYLNTVNAAIGIEGKKNGAVHPNAKGYQVYQAAILAKLRELIAPPAPTIVINHPNALGESTVVDNNNFFYIAWDGNSTTATSVRTAYRSLNEAPWQIDTNSRWNPASQRFILQRSGTLDFAISLCTPLRCSPWSAPVRASNQFDSFSAPDNLRLTDFTGNTITLAWDLPPHLSSAKYQIAWARQDRWIPIVVKDPETATTTVKDLDVGWHDLYIRQCAPRVWSQTETGLSTCSVWSSGLRIAAPPTVPSVPVFVGPDPSAENQFTVNWKIDSMNQTGSQIAFITETGVKDYTFSLLAGEITKYTLRTLPTAVRVRACNQVGCSDWSNDPFDPEHSTDSLAAASIPTFPAPAGVVPQVPLP